MPHMNLTLTATKFTTREGDHHDDETYLTQVKNEIENRIKDLGFVRADIKLEFGP